LDDGERCAVLHRAARVEELRLAVDLATCCFRGGAQLDERRVADAIDETRPDVHGVLASLALRFPGGTVDREMVCTQPVQRQRARTSSRCRASHCRASTPMALSMSLRSSMARASSNGRTLTRMFSPSASRPKMPPALVVSTRPRNVAQVSEQAPGL